MPKATTSSPLSLTVPRSPLPRRLIREGLRRFADHHSKEDDTVEGLKSLGYLLAFNTIFMGSFFFGGGGTFTWPVSKGMVGLWHVDPLGFGIWNFLFPIAGIWLLASTVMMKGVIKAHLFSSLVWLAMGSVWIAYSLAVHPDYVFGIGVLSIFISAQHFVYARLWKAEGVG